jgi:predicted nucleic acid-binding Zn ribbon protein
MAFDRLVDILKIIRSRNPALSKRLAEATALSRWENSVGTVIAKHSRAIRVQDGVLWVEVDHPIWKSELHHRKQQILKVLNLDRTDIRGPEAVISDILFLEPRC